VQSDPNGERALAFLHTLQLDFKVAGIKGRGGEERGVWCVQRIWSFTVFVQFTSGVGKGRPGA